jgi:hypothetical protein
MKNSVSTVKWGKLFSVDLPQEWSWSTDEGLVSVFRSDGVGILQISVLARGSRSQSKQADAIQLAQSYVKQQQWAIQDPGILTSSIDEFAIAMFDVVDNEISTYWQVWHLVGDDRAAFITYTCDFADSKIEATAREEIVKSFRWQ